MTISRMNRHKALRHVPVLTLVAGALMVAPADAATVKIRAAGAPSIVAGTDGRRHLVYELIVENATTSSVRLDRLDVVDPSRRSAVATYRGDAIADVTVDAQTVKPTRTVARGN